MIPGMPSLPGDFKGLVTSGVDALISFGGATLIRMVFGKQWGVFNQYGIPILLADTVYSVQYQNTSQISQAPVERGTFASYNKVQNPYQATVTMIRGGGDPTKRGLFIAQLEALANSTLKFHIVTPEYVHRDACIVGYDYVRMPQDGARMIAANLHLEEIREAVVTYETDDPKNPEDSQQVDIGEQQPQAPSESILRRVVDTINEDGGLVDQAQDVGSKLLEQFRRNPQQ